MATRLSRSGLNLPRRAGELAFDAPWQGTVFALAAAVIGHALGGDRADAVLRPGPGRG